VGSLFAALVVSYALAIFLVRGRADRREAERIVRAVAASLPDPRQRQLMLAPPPAEFVPARDLPPEPPRPTRCRSCPLYGCAVACPVVNPVPQASPYRARRDRCGTCVWNAAAGGEYCIDCDRAFDVISVAERADPVARVARELAECPSCHRPVAWSAHGCDEHRYPPPTGPGAASLAYRAGLKPAATRRVRGDLRCLACVQPVIQDDDGWWLFHSPSCPRERLPLEVAIGKRPPDPLYPPHRA
jgi:hypothetical protein